MSVDEHTIELAGSPVFYRAAPTAGEPILYLHGIPTSSDDWSAFLERGGGIAPDLPGFGRTGKGAHLDYSIEGHAVFVEAFATALNIERLRLVLHDWGAAGGLMFAQRHPDRVSKLVLIDAVPLLGGFTWPHLIRALRRPLVGELLMGSVNKRLLGNALAKAGSLPDAAVTRIWEQFDHGTQRAILRLYRSSDAARLADAGRDLERITAPALVVWGDRDPWLPWQLGEAYCRRLPNASLHRAPAGHWPWLDDPSLIDRIADFLQRT